MLVKMAAAGGGGGDCKGGRVTGGVGGGGPGEGDGGGDGNGKVCRRDGLVTKRVVTVQMHLLARVVPGPSIHPLPIQLRLHLDPLY